MRRLCLAIALTAIFASIESAWSDAYPSRAVTMVVPFAAGGPTDALARTLATRMSASLGQPVIVENVTGAAGTIGVGHVAHAARDGYTLSIGNWTSHVVNGAVYELKYDLLNDFEPIARLPSNPQLIVSRSSLPARDLPELIDWLKANQGKATAGTGGVGTAAHVSGIYFQSVTDTQFQFVPYRGTGPAILDLIAGHIDIMFDQSSNSMEQVRGGLIRPYAVTAKSRLATAPDIPTVDEVGLPGFYVSVWHGLWAPKGTPDRIIAKLNAAAVDAMADEANRQRFTQLGLDIPPLEQQTPESFKSFQRSEADKWWPLIRKAKVAVQ